MDECKLPTWFLRLFLQAQQIKYSMWALNSPTRQMMCAAAGIRIANINFILSCSTTYIGIMKVGDSGMKIFLQNQLNICVLTVQQYWLDIAKPKMSLNSIHWKFRHFVQQIFLLIFFTNQHYFILRSAFSPTAAGTMLASWYYFFTPLTPHSFFTAACRWQIAYEHSNN